MSGRHASPWRITIGALGVAAAVALGAADVAAQQKNQASTNAVAQPNQGASNAVAQKNQGPTNALQGFSQNRDEPVKIRAASLEVREKEKKATFTGDVYVVQGDTELRCKSLDVFYEEESPPQPSKQASARPMKAAEPGPGGDKQIQRIEAKGNVVVVQKDQNAAGDSATFNMRENTVTLVGNVVVTRGADVLRGQKLVVDLTSGVSRMEGQQGRVEGLFQRAPAEKK
jgi:lipopolysaccharide export system protein LptA